MASLGDYEKQLGGLESQMSQYTSDLPSQIKSEVDKAWTPTLTRAVGETQRMMSEFLPRYFETATQGQGMGTTAADLSPTQKLGVMGRELGTMGGQLAYNSKLSDYLGGQMNDMYNNALQAAQMGQQNLADQYSRAFQKYQMAWQQAESEKDRELQRSLSGGGGTTINLGGGLGDTTTPTSTGISPQDQKNLASLKTELSLISRIGAKNGITAQQRFEQARNIISGVIKSFPQLRSYINNKQAMAELFRVAGFSDRVNPVLVNPQMAEQLVQMF